MRLVNAELWDVVRTGNVGYKKLAGRLKMNQNTAYLTIAISSG